MDRENNKRKQNSVEINGVLIDKGCKGKVSANERPMTAEERMELLLHHPVNTKEDLEILGLLFSEDE